MLPWEHLAVGYLLYSLYSRLRHDRPPTGRAALLVALGTQLPDLIDKPLAWVFGVLSSGHSLGHSLLFAVPFLLGVWVVCRHYGVRHLSAAFGVGYLSHLPTDALHPALYGREIYPGFMVWPFGHWPLGLETFDAIIADVTSKFLLFMLTPEGQLYLLGDVLGVGLVGLLWVRDGKPGIAVLRGTLPTRGSTASSEAEEPVG